jgi:hypothetical protein
MVQPARADGDGDPAGVKEKSEVKDVPGPYRPGTPYPPLFCKCAF